MLDLAHVNGSKVLAPVIESFEVEVNLAPLHEVLVVSLPVRARRAGLTITWAVWTAMAMGSRIRAAILRYPYFIGN